MFYTNYIKVFLNTSFPGVTMLCLVKNWTVEFAHCLQHMVFAILRMGFQHCLRSLVLSAKTWLKFYLAVLLAHYPRKASWRLNPFWISFIWLSTALTTTLHLAIWRMLYRPGKPTVLFLFKQVYVKISIFQSFTLFFIIWSPSSCLVLQTTTTQKCSSSFTLTLQNMGGAPLTFMMNFLKWFPGFHGKKKSLPLTPIFFMQKKDHRILLQSYVSQRKCL